MSLFDLIIVTKLIVLIQSKMSGVICITNYNNITVIVYFILGIMLNVTVELIVCNHIYSIYKTYKNLALLILHRTMSRGAHIQHSCKKRRIRRDSRMA